MSKVSIDPTCSKKRFNLKGHKPFFAYIYNKFIKRLYYITTNEMSKVLIDITFFKINIICQRSQTYFFVYMSQTVNVTLKILYTNDVIYLYNHK